MRDPLPSLPRFERLSAISLSLAAAALLLLPLLAPGAAGAQEVPTQGVEGRSELVPDRYIVVFAPGVVNPRQTANQIARANGFAVQHVYTSALRGFSARIPEQALQFVRQDSRIAYVEQDRTVHLVAQTLPAGIDRIGADQNSTADIDNNHEALDVDIAVIDTGSGPHPDLDVVGGKNCIGSGDPDDDNGHGTHVAGTAAAMDNGSQVVGVAPGARIWSVKVLDSGGSGTISSVVCGIDFVTGQGGIEVANMSLGAQGVSDAMRTAIQGSVGTGTYYAVAAGNDKRDVYGSDGVFGTSDDFIPAAYPEVAAVSAMADFDGEPGGHGGSPVFIGCGRIGDDTFASCFSNYSASVTPENPLDFSPGAAIDLAAPGVSVLSTTNDGGTGSKTGTSMASPHVAGAAALHIVANGAATDAAEVASIRQALIDAGQPQSMWRNGDTEDPDTNPEHLVFVGDGTTSDPITDMAVTDVSAPSSVTQGDIVDVVVTVENVGNQDVTDQITVTLTEAPDGENIGSQTINGLDAGQSSDLTFAWDTGGASEGDHTLTASHDFGDDDASNDSASTAVSVTSDDTSTEVTVDGIQPTSASAGSTVEITITGSGFASGADVTFENGSGPSPSVSDVVVDTTNGTITATVTIKSGGPPRNRVWDVRVTNPDGSSGVLVGGFTVTP